jgi:dynein heavy chain, axonemal
MIFFTKTEINCMFRVFIEDWLGEKYVKRQNVNFEESFEETGPATPVFFILSPGVNPLKV